MLPLATRLKDQRRRARYPSSSRQFSYKDRTDLALFTRLKE